VGAFDAATDEVASFSNYYPQPVVNLLAPGVNIESDMPEWHVSETSEKSGTSMSAPHLTAAIAYIILKCSNKDPAYLTIEIGTDFTSEEADFDNDQILVRKVKPDLLTPCP